MSKDTGKKVVLGTVVGLAAGYVAGILTAPKSGKETRKDIKEGTLKAVKEAEKHLKKLYIDLGKVIDEANKRVTKLKGSAKEKLSVLIDEAKEAQDKVKEVLSAIRNGDADDPELKAAVKQANNAKDHLKNYLKKSK